MDELLTKVEIDNLAKNFIFDYLKKEGYVFLSSNVLDNGLIIFTAKKNDFDYLIAIKSAIAPNIPELDYDELDMLSDMARNNASMALFASVSLGSSNKERYEKSIALRGDDYYCKFKGFEHILY